MLANGERKSQMFLILQRASEVASISCVHCFDLSLGYLSNFYHSEKCVSVRGIVFNRLLLLGVFFHYFRFFFWG